MTQFGMYSQTTPRNDASPGRGQWNLDSAYRYISEGYGGYHWDVLNGINFDAGIFLSLASLNDSPAQSTGRFKAGPTSGRRNCPRGW